MTLRRRWIRSNLNFKKRKMGAKGGYSKTQKVRVFLDEEKVMDQKLTHFGDVGKLRRARAENLPERKKENG